MLSPTTVSRVLEAGLSTGADFAEIFAEKTETRELSLVDSNPDRIQSGTIAGAGIRLWFGTDVVYQTISSLNEADLIRAAKLAASFRTGKQAASFLVNFPEYDSIQKAAIGTDLQRVARMLKNIDLKARSQSSKITQVNPYILMSVQNVLIANSNGTWAEETRPHSRVYWTIHMQNSDGTTQMVNDRVGYGTTPQKLMDEHYFGVIEETVKRGELLLTAKPAPAGEFPVVIESGFGGVIFHEACGHGLETTSVAKNRSVFCGKIGTRVANECVTAIDDGTIEEGWGSLKFDDEGNPTQKTVLIENGILKNYMSDQMGAKLMNIPVTGSARRQSYKFAPTSRMRNTFIQAGKTPTEEMIRDVDFGIYAVKMGGGSVNTGTGEYNFAVDEGYIIERGEIKHPILGASLIGRGIETLGRIEKVGTNLELDSGMCGSISGSIPAAVGQPAILVSKILVGGTSK